MFRASQLRRLHAAGRDGDVRIGVQIKIASSRRVGRDWLAPSGLVDHLPLLVVVLRHIADAPTDAVSRPRLSDPGSLRFA